MVSTRKAAAGSLVGAVAMIGTLTTSAGPAAATYPWWPANFPLRHYVSLQPVPPAAAGKLSSCYKTGSAYICRNYDEVTGTLIPISDVDAISPFDATYGYQVHTKQGNEYEGCEWWGSSYRCHWKISNEWTVQVSNTKSHYYLRALSSTVNEVKCAVMFVSFWRSGGDPTKIRNQCDGVQF